MLTSCSTRGQCKALQLSLLARLRPPQRRNVDIKQRPRPRSGQGGHPRLEAG